MFDNFAAEYKNTDKYVLVVTHGGVINIIYHLVNGIEWNNKSPAFKSAPCGIHILNIDTMKFEAENFNGFLKNI